MNKASIAAFFARVKTMTWVYLSLLIAGSVASQTAWVQTHIIPVLAGHPHLAPIGTLILMMLTVIHNPLFSKVITSFESEQSSQGPDGTVKTTKVSSITTAPAPTDPPAV